MGSGTGGHPSDVVVVSTILVAGNRLNIFALQLIDPVAYSIVGISVGSSISWVQFGPIIGSLVPLAHSGLDPSGVSGCHGGIALHGRMWAALSGTDAAYLVAGGALAVRFLLACVGAVCMGCNDLP